MGLLPVVQPEVSVRVAGRCQGRKRHIAGA
jgi:hypothetical protein